MIRCLSTRPVSDATWRRLLFHPDPDALLATDDESPDAFSAVVSSIRVGRTHKLTRPNRLAIPNRTLCQHLPTHVDESFEFLDVGGSDGITTLEAVQALEERTRGPVKGCLIDPFIRLNRYRGGRIVEYRTPDQSPVMVRLGPIGLQLSSLDTSRDPISRALGRWYLGRTAFRRAMVVDATMSLVNPIVARDPRIEVREQDMLQFDPALAGRFHAVRASNLLHRQYFTDAQMETALTTLHRYLRDGGVLLVSRSLPSRDGESDHGAVWRRDADRFVILDRFGGGSEIETLVDGFSPRRRAPLPDARAGHSAARR